MFARSIGQKFVVYLCQCCESIPTNWRFAMRITLELDDELLAEAQRITGVNEKSTLAREALKAFVERESARRLALLSGTEPTLEVAPRRRAKP